MTQPNRMPALLTVEQTAEQLGISRARCYQLLNSGELRSVHVGRLRRIATDDLSDYIDGLRGRLTVASEVGR